MRTSGAKVRSWKMSDGGAFMASMMGSLVGFAFGRAKRCHRKRERRCYKIMQDVL